MWQGKQLVVLPLPPLLLQLCLFWKQKNVNKNKGYSVLKVLQELACYIDSNLSCLNLITGDSKISDTDSMLEADVDFHDAHINLLINL